MQFINFINKIELKSYDYEIRIYVFIVILSIFNGVKENSDFFNLLILFFFWIFMIFLLIFDIKYL